LIKVKDGRIEVSGDKEELMLDLGSVMLSLLEYTTIDVEDLELLLDKVQEARQMADIEDDEPEDFTDISNWSGLVKGFYNALSEED
jgi:hypothetical protein